MPHIYFRLGRWHVEPIRQMHCFGSPELHRRNWQAYLYVDAANNKIYETQRAQTTK